MLTRIAAFATSLALLSSPASPRAAGRPVILIVHGRGMLERDTASLRAHWQRALESGGRGYTRAPLLADDDVRLVWYADALDPRSSAGCDFAPSDPRRASRQGPNAELRGFASAVSGILTALTDLVDDHAENVQIRGFAGDLAFLADSRKRCAVDSRLAKALDRARAEGRPIVVVAHSFGSLVAYDHLSAAPRSAPAVERLVTVGAFIGAPELRQLFLGGSADDTLRLPPTVKSWTNVSNPNDPFATGFSRSILESPASRAVRDLTTDADSSRDVIDAHDVVGYLKDLVTAKAILSAWCSAFGSSRDRPAGCAEVPAV